MGRLGRWVVGASVALLPVELPAGVIRHDRDDAQYRALANLPEYEAVGQVRSAVGGASRLCSGTLIAPNWVLTAAHCLTNTDLDTVYYRNLGQSLDAKRIIVHPQFNGSASNGYDIGLIELDAPSELVSPAQRMRDLTPLGGTVTIVGYGLTGTGLTGSIVGTHGTKRAGQNIVDRNGTQVLDEFERPYPEFMLFTDFDNPDKPSDSRWGSSVPLDLEYQTAGGDSGGGWFLDDDGRARLYAVHSVGLSFDEAQDNDYGDAAGATRVTKFNTWIDQQLGDTYWMNPNGGAYDDPENWSSTAMPGAAANLRFAFPRDYTVDLPGDHQADRWTQVAGDVDFQLAAGNLQLGSWNLGAGASANLSIPVDHFAQVQNGVIGDGRAVVLGGGVLQLGGDSVLSGQFDIQEGGLELADGATANVGGMSWGTIGATQVRLGAHALLQSETPLSASAQVSVTLDQGATLRAPAFTQAGPLSLTAGRVSLDGALTQSESASTSIDVEPLLLDGAQTPITMGDKSTLGGTLRLALPKGFTLLKDRTVTLMSGAGPIVGTFSGVEWTRLPLGVEYKLTYQSNEVLLTLEGPGGFWTLDGDTNHDHVVNLFDLNNVRNNYGEVGGPGDVNGDGRVDIADLITVRNNFGMRRDGAIRAVPEPASWLLALISAIVCVLLTRSASEGEERSVVGAIWR